MSFDGLTVKERHSLNFHWRHLGECCFDRGRAVTAEEYSKFMGIAVSTARRALIRLTELETVETIRGVARNRYPKISYQPNGNGQTWDYTYGWYGADESEE